MLPINQATWLFRTDGDLQLCTTNIAAYGIILVLSAETLRGASGILVYQLLHVSQVVSDTS
jgi:hypothetical protein